MLTREKFLEDLSKFPREFFDSPEIKKLVREIQKLPPGAEVKYSDYLDEKKKK